MGLFSNITAKAKSELAAIRSGSANPEITYVVEAIENGLIPKLEQELESRVAPLIAQVLIKLDPQLAPAAALAQAAEMVLEAEKMLPKGTTANAGQAAKPPAAASVAAAVPAPAQESNATVAASGAKA